MNKLIGNLKDIINESLDKLNAKHQNLKEVIFDYPQDIKNGNLMTNVALINAKNLELKPFELAEKIVFDLNEKKPSEIMEIKYVKPGFINFYFTKDYAKSLYNLMRDEKYFQFDSKNENINVEFVSANPTGALHLGHARNASYGDSLANLLKRVGYQVIKEYYINDAGVQMNNLAKSVKAFYLEFCGEELDFPEDGYQGPEIKEIAHKIFSEFGNSKKEAELDFFQQYAYEKNMNEIKNIMKRLNIVFDYYASEKYYHDNNKVAEALKLLEDKGEIYELDAAKWLKTKKYGDDKDRVLEKSDHTHTYLTSDIAYHKDKFDRGADRLIDVWGGDHHGYVDRVQASLQSLGYDKSKAEIVLLQMVSILMNNEKVKMSKRKGTSVTINELLSKIDADVLRFFFIMRSPDTQLDFDIALAEKQNSDNPVFYIQYAHARIYKLLKKYQDENGLIEKANMTSNKLTSLDTNLIYEISKYPEILARAAKMERPHVVANYLYDVAALVHKYYNQEKIFGDDMEILQNKVLILNLVKYILNDGLAILGINAKNNM